MPQTKLYFPQRIPEPKQMGELETKVFDDLSKQNYRQWMIPLVDDALEISKLKRGKILDVGCGPGLLIKEFAQRSRAFEIVGIDISPQAIKLAKKNCMGLGNAIFKKARAEKLPFSQEVFNLVICKDNLHQFSSPKKVLKEIMRVLKPDGVLYIQDLRRDLPFYLLRRAMPRENTLQKLQYYSTRAAYTKKELAAIFRGLGIKHSIIRTRKITKRLKRYYAKLDLDIARLREAFQARYVVTVWRR